MAISPKCCSTLKSICLRDTYELPDGDLAVIVAVVPKHVLHHVVELLGGLVQHLHQCRLDLLLLELLVSIDVELH